MLATPYDVEIYKEKIDEFIKNKKGEISPYLETMIEQNRNVLLDNTDLYIPGSYTDFFESRQAIIKNLISYADEKQISELHIQLARVLRYISIAGTQNFNNHPIIKFYAMRQYDEIPLGSTDEILYGVALEVFRERSSEPLKKIESSAETIVKWDKKLEGWNERVASAELRYADILSANNYLGLSHAFKHIIDKKNNNADNQLRFLKLIGLAAFLLPALQVLLGNFTSLLEKPNLPLLSTVFFSITAEVILIYYFKLIHVRWTMLTNQISQLELRHAMCAFVHDYADKTKDLNRETLAKFENMIFSEITQDTNPPANIYDAADSISKLLTAWKKP